MKIEIKINIMLSKMLINPSCHLRINHWNFIRTGQRWKCQYYCKDTWISSKPQHSINYTKVTPALIVRKLTDSIPQIHWLNIIITKIINSFVGLL